MKYIDFKIQPYCNKHGHKVLKDGYCVYCNKYISNTKGIIVFLIIVLFIILFLIAGASDLNTERVMYGR